MEVDGELAVIEYDFPQEGVSSSRTRSFPNTSKAAGWAPNWWKPCSATSATRAGKWFPNAGSWHTMSSGTPNGKSSSTTRSLSNNLPRMPTAKGGALHRHRADRPVRALASGGSQSGCRPTTLRRFGPPRATARTEHRSEVRGRFHVLRTPGRAIRGFPRTHDRAENVRPGSGTAVHGFATELADGQGSAEIPH